MNTLLFIGTQEIIIIALVVLLLFGGKKIPELMRGLGKGVKSFKDGVGGIDEEIRNIDKEISTKKWVKEHLYLQKNTYLCRKLLT